MPVTKPLSRTKSRSGKYNSLKLRALQVFENRAWLNPPAWAILARFYPTRAAYSYLLRLHRFGLLRRRLDRRGLVIYSLADRGRRRLTFLRVSERSKMKV